METLKDKGLKVCEEANKEYGTYIAHRTVTNYVKKGFVGVSPRKRGRWPGGVGKQDFELLLRAFETFKQINQINVESAKNTQSHLIPLVNLVLRREGESI